MTHCDGAVVPFEGVLMFSMQHMIVLLGKAPVSSVSGVTQHRDSAPRLNTLKAQNGTAPAGVPGVLEELHQREPRRPQHHRGTAMPRARPR